MEKKRKRPALHPIKHLKKIIAIAALLIVGFFFPRLMAMMPEFTESVFSQGLYVWISSGLGYVMSLTAISVSEIVVFALFIAVIVLTVIYTVRFLMRRTTWLGFYRGFLTVLLIFAIALNAFHFTWGLNYCRPTLYSLMDLEVLKHTEDDLFSLCMRLTDEANALRGKVMTDESGIFMLNPDSDDVFTRVQEAYSFAGKDYPLISRSVYKAKPVSSSRLMSSAGISGVFMPVLSEANANVDQPDIALPFTAAHETAHYLGFARENEANFWAYIVCSSSENSDIRYSGTVNALMYCLSAAKKAAPERYSDLTDRFSEGLRADIVNYTDYWKDYRGAAADIFTDLNDAYLKFNAQEDGVLSYGGVVDLLLAFGV